MRKEFDAAKETAQPECAHSTPPSKPHIDQMCASNFIANAVKRINPLKNFQPVSPKVISQSFMSTFYERVPFVLQSIVSRMNTKTMVLRIDTCYKPSKKTVVPDYPDFFQGCLTVLTGTGYCVLASMLFSKERSQEICSHLRRLKNVLAQMSTERTIKLIYVDTCCGRKDMKKELHALFPGVSIKLDGFHWLKRWFEAFECSKNSKHYRWFIRAMALALYAPTDNEFKALLKNSNTVRAVRNESADSSGIDDEFEEEIKLLGDLHELKKVIPRPKVLLERVNIVIAALREIVARLDLSIMSKNFEKVVDRQLLHISNDCLSDPAEGPDFFKTQQGMTCARSTGSNESFHRTLNSLYANKSYVGPLFSNAMMLWHVESFNARRDVEKSKVAPAQIIFPERMHEVNSIFLHESKEVLYNQLHTLPINIDKMQAGCEAIPMACNAQLILDHLQKQNVVSNQLKNEVKSMLRNQSIKRDAKTYKMTSIKWCTLLCGKLGIPRFFHGDDIKAFEEWRKGLAYPVVESFIDKLIMDWSVFCVQQWCKRKENIGSWDLRPKQAIHFRAFIRKQTGPACADMNTTETVKDVLKSVGTHLKYPIGALKKTAMHLNMATASMDKVVDPVKIKTFAQFRVSATVMPDAAHAPLRTSLHKVPVIITFEVPLHRVRRKAPKINWKKVCANCGLSRKMNHSGRDFGISCKRARRTLNISILMEKFAKTSNTQTSLTSSS